MGFFGFWAMPWHFTDRFMPPPLPRRLELLELRPRIAPARPPWPATLRSFSHS